MLSDDVILLPDGRYEQKIQVDRRRLEAMITGSPIAGAVDVAFPNAEEFFNKAIQYSGAEVCWPSQLKIGAKTKKDPFVKVIGTLEQIERARTFINGKLQVKKERMTLKMEIHHSVHSHIIGWGGRGIQQVMRATGCHIHFPDSNKYTESANKSDQVSISGPPLQIENARRHLRAISPLMLSFDLPWVFSGQPEPISIPSEISLSIDLITSALYSCVIKANAGDDMLIIHVIGIVMAHFRVPVCFPVTIRTSVDIKEDITLILRQEGVIKRLNRLEHQYGGHVQILDKSQVVLIYGSIAAVLILRRFIIGLSQVVLTFDVPVSDIQGNISRTEKNFNVSIHTKRKNHGQDVVAVSIKSTEEHVIDMFQARDHLLGFVGMAYRENEYNNLKESNDQLSIRANISTDQAYPETVSNTKNDAPHPSAYSNVNSIHGSIFNGINLPQNPIFDPVPQNRECPKSPDPENSPLAASILKGAKDYSKNNDLWIKSFSSRSDRDQMLIKATQAIFDDTPRSKTVPRYPTDLWAGYGFSCSLPADLLKGLLEFSEESDAQEGRPILGRDAKTPPSRGLCSVREEDELSDFSGSLSSTSVNSAPRVFERKNRIAFSASTSIFDSSSAGSEFKWDIRLFLDPAMVLAQLGCSEYMVQLRDQEIDMQAFLLLDEQNLKDIGVSTIGARKKIHHAILKLRDSARLYGHII